jgi:hypothetical protein
MQKITYLLKGLLLAAVLFSGFQVTQVMAEGEPVQEFPNSTNICNQWGVNRPDNPTGSTCGNNNGSSLLYLAVGIGEHTSNITTTEVYSGSGGSFRLTIVNSGFCATASSGRAFDFQPGGAKTTFTLRYRLSILATVNSGAGCGDDYMDVTAPANSTLYLESSVSCSANCENQYRVLVNNSATLGGGKYPDGFSIANTDLPESGDSQLSSYSTYALYFGTECSYSNGNRIKFHDDDYGNYQHAGEKYYLPPRNVDTVNYYRPLLVNLLARKRIPVLEAGFSPVKTDVELTGGDGIGSYFILDYALQPGTDYMLQIFGLTRPNALEIFVPNQTSQKNVGTTCFSGPPPACSISFFDQAGNPATASNPIRPNQAYGIKYTIDNPSTADFRPYALGVNGLGVHPGSDDYSFNGSGQPYPNEVLKGKPGTDNYLVPPGLRRYIRYGFGPTVSAGTSYTSSLLNSYPYVDYTFGNSNGTSFVAPGAVGSYPFDWGFVISGAGWADVVCRSSLTVAFPPPPPAPAIACFFVAGGATNIEPGEPFKPRITVTNLSGTSTFGGNVSVSVESLPSGGSITNSSQVTGGFNVSTPGSVDIGNAAPSATALADMVPSSTGRYNIRADVSGNAPSATCRTVVDVISRPYFRVLNGDIVSSGGGVIKGWNKKGLSYTGPGAVLDSNGRSGAGGQGLVIGSAVVEGVSSGVLLSSFTTSKDLTFANTGGTTFGGGFGNPGSVVPIDTSTGPYTGNSSGVFYSAAGMSYSNTAIGNKLRMTVFVRTGDLTINNNIVYSNTPGSVSDIPHIKFVVMEGNINIDPSVVQIDAELISVRGTIDTCVPLTYSGCQNTLLVNGSLSASKIKLNRVRGTLRESRGTDGLPSSCAPGTVVAPLGGLRYCNGSNIAEIIQFTPELYLAPPADSTTGSAGAGYDAITALPPIF